MRKYYLILTTLLCWQVNAASLLDKLKEKWEKIDEEQIMIAVAGCSIVFFGGLMITEFLALCKGGAILEACSDNACQQLENFEAVNPEDYEEALDVMRQAYAVE